MHKIDKQAVITQQSIYAMIAQTDFYTQQKQTQHHRRQQETSRIANIDQIIGVNKPQFSQIT